MPNSSQIVASNSVAARKGLSTKAISVLSGNCSNRQRLTVVLQVSTNDKGGVVATYQRLTLPGMSALWQGNTVSKRKVTAEKMAGGKVMILGDVKPGDVVVTAGVSYLREGMKVNPLGKRAD